MPAGEAVLLSCIDAAHQALRRDPDNVVALNNLGISLAVLATEEDALRGHFGRPGICDSAARPGCQPLGVAFELAPDVPTERIPPGRTIPARTCFTPPG